MSVHRRLDFDPRELAYRPLAVVATRAASCAPALERGDDFVFVVRRNSLVAIHRVLLELVADAHTKFQVAQKKERTTSWCNRAIAIEGVVMRAPAGERRRQ
jgi:hypothetical protein